MDSIGMPEFILVAALCASLLTVVWPMSRICRRAGFSPWLGLLAIVPIANVVLLWFLALAEWPAGQTRGAAA
jgi:hypothetical protein